MKAEIVHGHLQVYPETEEEETRLIDFLQTGANEKVGTVWKTVEGGVPLNPPKLHMAQMTLKGTKLED